MEKDEFAASHSKVLPRIFQMVWTKKSPAYLGFVAAALTLTSAFEATTSEIVVDPPVLLNSNGRTDEGNDTNPQISTDGKGVWLVVWHSFDSLNGTIGNDSDVLISRSLDEGQTWSTPVPLNSTASSDSGSDELPQITTDGKGNWVTVWYSSENLHGAAGHDTDIFVAISTDDGETWTSPALLNTNGLVDHGDDAWPQVTTDGAGKWIAVWWSRENLEGAAGNDIDLLTATSTDNGVTWSSPVLAHSNATADLSTDSEPRLTTDRLGNWTMVWRTTLGHQLDTDILVTTSSDNGATWSHPVPLNTSASSDKGDDNYPQVATDGSGNWLAVWRSTEQLNSSTGSDRDILYSVSVDNGSTWTAPSLLNTNGSTDTGKDEIPQIVTDQRGHWIVVWWSNENLNGTAGTDDDVFVALSQDSGSTWSNPTLLNSNGDVDFGGDFVPQVATNGKGKWIAVWGSEDDFGGPLGTDLDIFIATFRIDFHQVP